MTQEEREKFNRTPIDVVITRSCKAKTDDDSKVKEFAVGQVISINGKYAAELTSLGKAAKKDSPEHKKWVADEAKKAESKKVLAPSQISQAEAIAKLAAAIEGNTKAVAQVLASLAGNKKEK